jgi:tetratricopeptide (TPR) repeat protein
MFVKRPPNSIEELLTMAQLSSREEAWDETDALLRKAHRLEPSHPQARSLYARICTRLGRPYEALGLWAPLIRSDTFKRPDLAPLISALERVGELGLTKTLAGELWTQHKDSKEVTELYVEICLVDLDAESASATLRAYREAVPDDRSFDSLNTSVDARDWLALAGRYYEQKRFSTAERLSRHALSNAPENHKAAHLLVESLSRSGQWQKASQTSRLYAALTNDTKTLSSDGIEELADPQSYCRSIKKQFGLEDKTWIFVAHAKTGDHFYFFSLMKAFKEQQRRIGGVDHVTILINPNHRGIAELFADHLDRVEILEKCNVRAIRAATSQLRPGVPLVANPTTLLKNLDGTPRTLLPDGIVKFSDWLKFALGLPLSTPLVAPTVSDANRQKASEFLRENGMPLGRSVIIAPAATSVPALPTEMWALLVSKLQDCGYSLFLNVGPEKDVPKFEGVRPISFPHNLAIPLVEAAGWIIANRSGLADIVASARARITITYPRFLRERNRPWSLRERWRLNHFTVQGRDLEEIECFVDDPPERTVGLILSEATASAARSSLLRGARQPQLDREPACHPSSIA